jgi:hypothetical protein
MRLDPPEPTLLIFLAGPAGAFWLGALFGALIVALVAAGLLWLRTRRVAQAGDARTTLAFERHFNPYISGEPVRAPEMFFARHDLLDRIISGLHQNSILIEGERRIGKTSLLYQLADRLRATDDPEWVFIPVPVDLEGTPEERFFHLLMEAVWGAARGSLADPVPALYFHTIAPAQYTDRDFAADLRILLRALRPAVSPRRPRLVLLVDEVDALNGYDALIQQQFRRILVSDLAENMGAVVAGARISKDWDREESPWYNLFYEIPLEPFTDAQARQLLTEPVRGIYEWDARALDAVVRSSDGRPYRLQQLAFGAVNHMLADRRLHLAAEDVQSAEEALPKARR